MEYSCRKKKTKREEFLESMEKIIPWEKWVGMIAPYYPSEKRGRLPMGIEKMLRMYLLQIWFALSDPATEDAIYDSYAMRKFTGINFLTESVPDETTLCKFRHLLEEHGLNKLFFDAINRVMEGTGHMLKGGTIVDATIINAPSSTKNAQKARDPEMHQTKKGNAWRFGMKCHVGVDAFSGLVHTITVTAANVHDITQAAHLIRKDDEFMYGDSAYLGIQKMSEVAGDPHLSSIDYRINRRPSSLPRVSDRALDWERQIKSLSRNKSNCGIIPEVIKMSDKKSYQAWTISDEFWEAIKEEIPKKERDPGKEYKNAPGQGRKPMPARKALEGIFYVLRTGCQWKALPREYGSGSTVHRRFQEWQAAGFFEKIWRKGLERYDELEGIGWEWQSLDGCMVKAPLALESVGKNPTDRGKNGDKTQCADG